MTRFLRDLRLLFGEPDRLEDLDELCWDEEELQHVSELTPLSAAVEDFEDFEDFDELCCDEEELQHVSGLTPFSAAPTWNIGVWSRFTEGTDLRLGGTQRWANSCLRRFDSGSDCGST